MINKEHIFINCKYETPNEVIDNLVELLNLPEKTKELIKKREETRSTSMVEGFALPHCRLLDDKQKDIMSICVLEKPIIWDRFPVQIILLICNSSGSVIYIKSLASMCKILQKKDVKDKILNSKTVDDIYIILNS